jgi:outer membrane protein assembly factor BamB
VIASDEEGLVAVNESGERLWNLPLSGAVPAGAPVPVEGGFCLATKDGTVHRIDADGNLVAEVDSGEPIVAGPVLQGSNLLVAGIGGTLRVLPLPE